MYEFELTDSPDVQSINHTSGYIDTYLFMSLVDMESITNIFVSSCKEKSFRSSRIFSFRKSARLCIPQEFPRNSLGIPFLGFSDLRKGVPF
jgi:hypothetical protein